MLDFLVVAMQLKLVVDVQNGASGIAEDSVNALLQQAFHQNLGCCHSHGMISSFGNVFLDGSNKKCSVLTLGRSIKLRGTT